MKNLYLLTLVCIISAHTYSQTLLFGGSTGNGNFENGNSDWVFVNGSQTNKWVVGNNATPGFGGNSCIYISSDGSAHQYSTGSPTYSYFYKDVAIPADAKSLWLIFDYISNGESDTSAFGVEALDALRIWTRGTNTQVIAGEELDNVFISAGAGFYGRNSWRKRYVMPVSVSTYAGSTMRLIFQWFNNGSNGNQPPAALDNIEFYSSCQEFIFPYTDVDISATTATIIWNTVGGATGYNLRYKKLSEPNTVPSYANPIVVPGGTTYFKTLTNLSPGSDYVAELSPIGLSCTEYSSPAYFATLPVPANDSCNGALLLPVWSSAQAGTVSTFRGSTPTALPSSCANGSNNDVWFKFVAQNAQQTIQTNDPSYQGSFYSATDITLFVGDCDILVPISHPCASQTNSIYQGGLVSRVVATGLSVGTTYYIRVNTNNNSGYNDFAISVYNPIAAPDCPQLIQPINDSVLNYGTPYTFKWRKADRADAFRLRIFEESGAYTEVRTRDTSYDFTPVPGSNYTWLAQPYNVLDIGNGCTAATFSTCAVIANPVTITATSATAKCGTDSVKLKASASGNIQWFFNNVAIPGANADSIWAKQAGNYSLRLRDGSCYSDASNVIAITNLATPVKPVLNPTGSTTICAGTSATLTTSLSLNNQWFAGTSSIPGANGSSYLTSTAGQYHLRVTNSSSGCHNYSDTVNVIVTALPATPVITALTSVNFCSGDSVKLKSPVNTGNKWYKDGVLIADATDSIYVAKTSGSYTLKTTVNNCTSLESAPKVVVVSVAPTTPPVVSSTGSLIFCLGENTAQLSSSVTLDNQWFKNGNLIAGATGVNYQPLESGDYAVKTNVNGCYSGISNSISVTVNPLPTKPVITATGFKLSTASGANSYAWFLNAAPIAGATTNEHIVLVAGTYRVQISDTKGCKNTSDNFNAVVTGTNDVNLLGYKISLYPNPVTEFVTIDVNPGNSAMKKFTASLTDMYGKLITTKQLRDGVNTIPMNGLAQGHYFLSIRNGNTVRTVKLMKTK